MAYLSDLSGNRDNNFNLIRFLAATLVIYSHSFPLLLGDEYTEPLMKIMNFSMGKVAVDIFFISSGYLIATSFYNRKSTLSFIWARVLRIYPALWFVILLCVFVLGPIATQYSLGEYFNHSYAYNFLIVNSLCFTKTAVSLPGVFENLPYRNTVNGSLWTLPYEIKMYASIAIISLVIQKLNKHILKPSILFLTVLATIVNIYKHFLGLGYSDTMHFFSFFFIGVCFYLYQDVIKLNSKLFTILLTVLIAAVTLWESKSFGVYTLTLPYILFYLVYLPKGWIRKFNTLGDYSYGLYIFAFPVQQLFVLYFSKSLSVNSLFAYSFGISLVVAIASWHFLEKPMLAKKHKLPIKKAFSLA